MLRRTFLKGLLCLPFIGLVKEEFLEVLEPIPVPGIDYLPPYHPNCRSIVIQNAWSTASSQDILLNIAEVMKNTSYPRRVA